MDVGVWSPNRTRGGYSYTGQRGTDTDRYTESGLLFLSVTPVKYDPWDFYVEVTDETLSVPVENDSLFFRPTGSGLSDGTRTWTGERTESKGRPPSKSGSYPSVALSTIPGQNHTSPMALFYSI